MTKIKLFRFLFILFLINSLKAQKNELLSIQATSNKIDIRDGDNFMKGNWTLIPNIKPDIYKTDVINNSKKKITFYSDIDSISFIVENNKIYDFNIILNKKDTFWTQINTIPKFYFDKNYIKKNKGKYSFEIPEVQELVHVIIALTPTGIQDKNMVEQDSEYYTKVFNYFEKYKSEDIITKIDKFLKKDGYSVLKMDACGYVFKNDRIVKDGVYEKLNWDDKNYAEPYIHEIEKFAKLTNFRKFYAENKVYYNELIEKMEKQTPIKKQWKWLEKNSKLRYDNYRITFSPLVNGSHSTNKFIQNDFKQTVMFICGPFEKSGFEEKMIEALMTRVVFTEIDHNYVNPISDNYNLEIKKSLKNLDKWATKDALSDYGNAYTIFNEYMTWGVFTLYTLENFNEKDFELINNRVEKQMSEWRGFSKFKEFNRMLIEFHKTKVMKNDIENLYPVALKWFSEQ